MTTAAPRTTSRIPASAWSDSPTPPELPPRNTDGLARALGWFSIGLGATQLFAPRRLARVVGVDDDARTMLLMRGLGVREIASGIAILADPEDPRRLATRVAGDLMDLALLGSALRGDGHRTRTGVAVAAVVGAGVLDAFATARTRSQRRAEEHPESSGITVHKAMTVTRSPEEAYRLWRDFEGLPRFMRHLESVRVTGEGYSHWVARGPGGTRFEWDAELLDDRPGELIAWRSLPDSSVAHAGRVRFRPAPGDRGTEVHVELRYAPPAGRPGALIAKLFGREPSQQVDGDLRRFKQVLETGEVVHSDSSIHRGPHPAQPSKE